MMTQRHIHSALTMFVLIFNLSTLAPIANAGVALFTRATDTILVPGHTSVSDQMTMEVEARFYLTESAWGGDIFHEQYFAQCDKVLQADPAYVLGAAYPDNNGIQAPAPGANVDIWHHVAWVRDHTIERLYFDGIMIRSQSNLFTTIGNSASSWMSVGSFQYTAMGPSGWHCSFLGALKWLRVSSNARYTGPTFTIPAEPSTTDPTTLLFYNFSDASGSSVVTDLSTNHWDGQLGVGHFSGPETPTSPTLVSDSYIISQPTNVVGISGHSATFNVGVIDPSSAHYQWYFNTNTLLVNATNASLTLTHLQATNAGKYSVVVSSQYGSTSSALAQLTLYDPYTEIEVEWYFGAYLGAGLYIAGQPGSNYVLRYTTDLRNTNWTTWTPLATNQMGSSGWWFFLDEESPNSPYRFYGAKRLQE